MIRKLKFALAGYFRSPAKSYFQWKKENWHWFPIPFRNQSKSRIEK